MWWDKPGQKKVQAKEPEPFPFMKFRFAGFFLTALVLIGTTVSLLTQGLNLGLDFTGGIQVQAAQATPFDVEKVRASVLNAGFTDSNVNTADDGTTVFIRVPLEEGADIETTTRKVTAALDEGVVIRDTSSVSGKVSGELLQSGIIASVLAVVGIGAYVWFRFESKFGWAAFLTTFHDVYGVIGLFSITQMNFDLTIVAGILTVAGYSVNDTVVVFDRIREMLKKYKKLSIPRIIDVSITATLSRTLITSVSALLVSVAMMLLGGPVLYGFAASIVFGIIIGTYSSIFVAAPLLMYLPGRIPGARWTGAERETAEAAS